MKKFTFDWGKYVAASRLAAAEGSVLLKNDKETLPVKKGGTVALFGRSQFDYIKSGTGSGGLVNVPYVVNYYDGIKNCEDLNIYEPLSDIYTKGLEENPFDKGGGWAQEPFSQVEMPVSDEVAKDAAANADVAVIFFSRLCGEDKDCTPTEGCYYLRQDERDLLSVVCKNFDKVAVLLNSGDLIDMNWVEEYNPGAVMYIWQGGCEGGNAVADLLSGKVTPSGHLAETIAKEITDYPSNDDFGDPVRNFYKEDIYVGYRYFETFKQDRVLYPFGFGLSYTEFEETYCFSFDQAFEIRAMVKNAGKMPGKQVIQVYAEAPQGFLGKPAKVLVAFGKTKLLNPGDTDVIFLNWGLNEMASYDDTGMTGNKNSFVLEAGEYIFHAGTDASNTVPVGSFVLGETTVLETTEAALYPIDGFERIMPELTENGYVRVKVPTPVRDWDWKDRLEEDRAEMKEIPYTGDKGIKLSDVKEGRATMDDFIAQISDEDMMAMTRGEGMSSTRVIPGTCAAYGGITDSLQALGIPAAACTDGPSGLRIDSGVVALQGPNGSCLASTFDTELVKELYSYVGEELLKDKIDCLLGPGMNIKRHPLNGRNFEYFSEDPLLTGKMAAAQLNGMAKYNTTACIKHYACNNQETARYRSDSVVSARALREIYLKGYEIAVKEGNAKHIMTTYGSLNGFHTAGSYELNTLVLRKDWGYTGLVETDWWAVVGDEHDADPTIQKTSFMIRSQNDLYMVTNSSEANENNDDTPEGFKNGVFTKAELQRNVKNVINVVMNLPAYDRMMGEEYEFEEIDKPSERDVAADVQLSLSVRTGTTLDADLLSTEKGAINMIKLDFEEKGDYLMKFELGVEGSLLSQLSTTFSVNNTVMKVITKNGGNSEWTQESVVMGHGSSTERFLKITFSQTGLKFRNIVFEKMQ